MRNLLKKDFKFLCYLIIGHIFVEAAMCDLAVSNGMVGVRFNNISKTIEITDTEIGTVLYNGVIAISDSSTADRALPVTADVNSVNGELIINADNEVKIWAKCEQGDIVTIIAQSAGGKSLQFRSFSSSDSAIPAISQKARATDRNVLFTTLGAAELSSNALFDISRDCLLVVESSAGVQWRWDNGWQIQTGVSSKELTVSIKVNRHYYRDELGLGYFAPLQKTSFWGTAPVVALTWYGINTYGGDSKQKKEWLYPQIDFVAQNLLPYAGKMVFQLDDNYYFNDDKYMREISDYIRSKGMIPGIWFTPFSIAPRSVAESHPAWFLHDNNGKLLTSFGGCNWGYKADDQPYILNVHDPQAASQWYKMFWSKASMTWNYDYFKLDAALNAFDAYNTSIEGGGPYGYRKGLQIARDIIGPDKFINNCSPGPIAAAIGLIQGSRIGLDSAACDHAIDVMQRWNFLNNIVLWCDADAIANSYQKPTEIIRSNVTARALTGQQFLTDDMWTRMPAPAIKIMQKGMPVLDIRPGNLYKIENWRDYDIFDLKIAKEWGSWDVAALFNYSGVATSKILDLSRLRLTSEYLYVFEYWSSKYLGRFDRNAKLQRYLMPYDVEVFAIVPVSDNKPTLLSTSRHISQGSLDIDNIKYTGDVNDWIVSGTSENLVAGENYQLVFTSFNYKPVNVKADVNSTVDSNNGIVRLNFVPKSSCLNWRIEFAHISKPTLQLTPEQTQMKPGESVQFELANPDANAADWRISISDPRINIGPVSGRLAPHESIKLTAVADINSFSEPGHYKAMLSVIDAVSGNTRCQSKIIIPVLQKNLAANAKIRVSTCETGFDPNFATDSDSHTAWCSTVKDKNGAWIELVWDNPVTINRVVLDEFTGQFTQIQEWHLEIEQAGTMTSIKRGTFVDRRKAIQLDNPCLTSRIRYVIDKAINMPGLWGIEVFEK
ncbi:MAG: hypothetical protein ABFD79_07600 [Phycisphaerales bacterium]